MATGKQETGSWSRVRAVMRERGEATRPQLAEATGLSQVLVGRVVAGMCRTGELVALGAVASGGGRPVCLYGYCYPPTALFVAQREGTLVGGRLELLDGKGRVSHTEQAHFAMLHGQSLDGWLDAAARRCTLGRIVLDVPPALSTGELERHLRQRYGCGVRRITAAGVLADSQDGALTLALPQGKEPTACIRRAGRLEHGGRLGLLPLPTDWESLNYEDHTLVEEMVARLLQILTCTLAPRVMVLHAGFWTERLIGRIRYNLSAKLKENPAPRLTFRSTTAAELDARRRLFCLHGTD